MEPIENKRKNKKPLHLSIHTIDETGIRLDVEENPEVFPILADMIQSGEIIFTSPVRISAKISQDGELVRVNGTVGVSVRLSCGRCLTDFEAQLSDEVSLIYTRILPMGEAPDVEEKELTADEIGVNHFQGEHIDLRDAIQEQVVMMLPQKPLCSESCKGLCPQCGADLNAENCGCKEPVLDDRLAVLKDLKIKGTKD